jgi:hypothetical protein
MPWAVVRLQLARVAILLIGTLSIGLVWWSILHRLSPISRQVRDRSVEMARLANEVQDLEMNWRARDAAETELRFKQAETLLVAGEPSLLKWQKETERVAEALALQASTQAGKAKAYDDARVGLALLPLSIDVRPLESLQATNRPYARLLEFTRLLDASSKRLDMVEFTVRGSSNSIQQAKMVVDVWSRIPQQ